MTATPFRETDHSRDSAGKFAPSERPEVDMELEENPAVVVPKGSFFYPPFLHSGEEAIAFWENAEIPDQAIARTAGSYVSTWAACVETLPDVYREVEEENYAQENPPPSSPAERAEWDRAKQQVFDLRTEAYREQLRSRPEFLDPRDARTATKVIGLKKSAREIGDPVEAEKINQHLVETTRGWVPTGEVYRSWGLAQFTASVTDSNSYAGRDEQIALAVSTLVDRRFEALSQDVRDEFAQNADNIRSMAEHIADQLNPGRAKHKEG